MGAGGLAGWGLAWRDGVVLPGGLAVFRVNDATQYSGFTSLDMGAATVNNDTEKSTAKDAIIHAPAGLGTALLVLVSAIVAGGLYLIVVRGDALFLDLAALSGLLFCF